MQALIKYIQENTTNNTKEIERSILEMICAKDDPIPLTPQSLLNALSLEGEFLVLKLSYSDLENELKDEKIKYKISQALSVVVSYEDDGKSFNEIEKFVNYIYNASDEKQHSVFGVKKVQKHSEYPIKILFSGILPINQLRMTVGKKIDAFIHSDDKYFIPRFQKHRDDISKEVGIPILPVLPILDRELDESSVRLVDMMDSRVICEFRVDEDLNKESMEIYLLKLFYIYKVLLEEARDLSK